MMGTLVVDIFDAHKVSDMFKRFPPPAKG